MLPFETHFESVLAVNLRDVVAELESGSDFVRREKSVAAQSGQPVDPEGGKNNVVLHVVGTQRLVIVVDKRNGVL